MKKIIIFISLSLNIVSAEDFNKSFQEGNNLMEEKDFIEASKLYESILEVHPSNSELYYNLGNAYYRLNNIGLAIWAYSQAISLNPRDDDIKYNLLLAKSKRIDNIKISETFVIFTKYIFLRNYFRFNEWFFISSISFLILIISITLCNIFYNIKELLNYMVGPLLIINLLVHGITFDKYVKLKFEKKAVFIAQSVDVSSEPNLVDGKIIFKIHEGTICDILNQRENWSKVALKDGKIGWVKNKYYRSLK